MREIRFRAWDKKEKVMLSTTDLVEKDYVLLASGFFMEPTACGSPPDTWLNLGSLEDLIPMQFTGLHDKNGKEIYEGDIVRHRYTPADAPEAFSVFDVSWKGVGFDIEPYPEDYEVIGNIWETPELLDEKKTSQVAT